jgi:hypothetical protein
MTPLVHLGVHVGRAAQHLAPRREDAPPADRCLRLALERPIDLALEELGHACRNRNEAIPGRSTGFEQENPEFSGVGEPFGQDAARRSGADDNKIVGVTHVFPAPQYCPLAASPPGGQASDSSP